ncbi:alpha-L-rhamnosidase [Niastella caeni]|uniref:alpha-L-rhamnosidase n=1 Tax=Niastella caeni TaxID=2569763 RepID=A0A4S8I141_9BACT|nr:alpha-L-rhamnosidase [Niastella caeni]THU40214.1 alpha-L-rhamnosidase [Niastella caeni]
MRPGKLISILSLFLCVVIPFCLKADTVKIVHLKTEYTEMPLGIDVIHPRFSWQMKAEERGSYQTAYQITVIDEANLEVWNSGKMQEGISLNIRYAGLPLKPRTRYTWKVMVWDQHQKEHTAQSWFETGLLHTDPLLSAWNGARWIGGGNKDMVLYSSYLPVFKLSFSLQLDKLSGTTRAGFIYGANDSRLMDKNKNLYRLQSPKDSSFILIELNLTTLQSKGAATLHVYRSGYAPKDTRNIPFKSFSIPASLVNKENKYEVHTIYLSSVLGDTYIYMDGTEKENAIGRVNLNPLGQGGDFIAYPVVGDIGFSLPAGQTAIFSNIQIRNYRSPSNILYSQDSSSQITGKGEPSFVTINPSRNSLPMLRKPFSTSDHPIAKARLYATSRGVYEMYINGKRIGNDYFNPGLTQYNKTHLYQTYDVTKEVITGKNVIGAILAEGWWSGGSTYMGEFWNFFGDRQSLLAQLVITYTDGKEEIITTEPDTWTYYNNGPVVYGSFFQGEVYDATKEPLIAGWNTANFDDSHWSKPVEVTLDNHISKDERNKAFNMPMVDDYRNLAMVGQFGQTVKKVKEITAISAKEVRPGVYVYDMGQNIAGVPKVNLKDMKPGSMIMLRFAEVKYPDLPEYKDHAGMIMLENIRAAMSKDIYVAKGGDETINPRFTYHGYRYVEVTGIPRALPLEAVKGEVLSSVHALSSKYETSSPEVNKLWENITWSTLANFMSIPTDCPQRNERLGWSGDISVFSRTATYLADVPQFFRRHMLAMRDVQREDGRFTDVAPLGGGFGGVLWGSAGITVAWESYQQYGDKDLLAEHYEAMKRYIRFLVQDIDPQTGVLYEKERKVWSSLGDWLSLEYEKSEKALLWESYFIYDLEQMAKIASILGNKQDEEWFTKLSKERKYFFNKTFVDSKTGKTIFRGKPIDTQTSYVLPLQFNLFNEENRPAAGRNLAATIKRENKADDGTVCPPYSLMTGFIGTAWINEVLSENGYTDLAYRLLYQTSYPSWLYPVKQGATTIWERLNSYTHINGFGGNNRMNSFNHYSFGAVGAWMYSRSLGISRDENNPAFRHFILMPEPDPTKKMRYAKGYYDAMYGTIESSWKIKEQETMYHFTIPANSSATLYLHAASLNHILEQDKALQHSKGVKYVGMHKGKYAFELQSGNYSIQVRK